MSTKPQGMSDAPPAGTRWQHYNGNTYTVIALTNVQSSDPTKYPVSVVYRGNNGLLWSRPLHDWHRSMTFVADGWLIRALRALARTVTGATQ